MNFPEITDQPETVVGFDVTPGEILQIEIDLAGNKLPQLAPIRGRQARWLLLPSTDSRRSDRRRAYRALIVSPTF